MWVTYHQHLFIITTLMKYQAIVLSKYSHIRHWTHHGLLWNSREQLRSYHSPPLAVSSLLSSCRSISQFNWDFSASQFSISAWCGTESNAFEIEEYGSNLFTFLYDCNSNHPLVVSGGAVTVDLPPWNNWHQELSMCLSRSLLIENWE